MDFAHYTDDPVRLAVELVNTYGWTSGTEHLHSVEDVARLLEEHGGVWIESFPSPAESDLTGLRGLRASLRRVFDSSTAEDAAAIINSLLAVHGAVPSLSTHGQGPHLHFETEEGSLTDWVGVVTAMGLATVIADFGFERLGICRSDECRDVYIDTSRNRSRRHCSDQCRIRENVSAHRQRQKT